MDCVICYDLIGDTNKCVTPCGHNFCFNCIMKATQYNSKCPYCRNELREEASNIVDNDEDEDSEDEDSDDEDSDDETSLISNIQPLTMDDLTINDKNTGTYDNNGYYKYPLIIETLEQLQSALCKCIPEGYTTIFKDAYDDDVSDTDSTGDLYQLLNEIKKKMPDFNYADMSNDHINMEYIQYARQKEKSDTKCYEIFKRTRLLMKVVNSKRQNIYNQIRYEMDNSRTQTGEFHVIRANDNDQTICDILS